MAEAGADLKAKAVHGAKAEHVAKAEHAAAAEERAKIVFAARVEREAKAGLAVGVGAGVGAEERRVTYEARAEPGDLGHEVVVVRRAMAKKER